MSDNIKQRLGIGSFEARWPGLADTIREGQEAKRRALSGPTAAEVHQAEMAQIIANVQRQGQRIQEQTIIFDEKRSNHMTINNKEYTTPVLNFGAMCKLEGWGLQIGDLSSRPPGFLAGFVGLAIGEDMAGGQAAIDEHLENGGSLDALTDALNQAVEASGFFKQKEEEKASA